MMSKWSSKPADHNAVRLRNNQRRHRQRVKDHAAELEARLADTQRQLAQSQARIAELSRELNELKMQRDSMLSRGQGIIRGTPSSSDLPPEDNDIVPSVSLLEFPNVVIQPYSLSPQAREEETSPQPAQIPNQIMSSQVSASYRHPIPSASKETHAAMYFMIPNETESPNFEEQSCYGLPPPEPGKSTTLCRDAYLIIHQQNYKGLDNSLIHEWLASGFRAEFHPGDGCRVDTDLLFTLLDFISSPN